MRRLAFGPLLAAACSAGPVHERLTDEGRVASPIIAGRLSGDDENATVFIVKQSALDGNVSHFCSGHLVAPGLVISARHCFLADSSSNENLLCNPDGSPAKEIDDQTIALPSEIVVYVGAHKSEQRPVPVKQVLTELEVSVCRFDLAFLVLSESALDVHTPFRRAPVTIGESFAISGWGYTTDDPEKRRVPDDRTSLDKITVTEVGPGFIPGGSFAIGGNTICLGDSGAAARIGGAIVGVVSRTDGPTTCALTGTRNILQGTAAQALLVERAFAAIGEKPTYIEDQVPDAGPVTEDAGVSPTPDADAAAPPPAPAAPADESCALSRSQPHARGPLLTAFLAVLWVARRRGRKHPRRRSPVSSP